MTNETMTIHKALAELKLLEQRIDTGIHAKIHCSVAKNSTLKINGETIEEYKNSSKEAYQSVNDLIRRRDAIKKAVSKSNASTIVRVNEIDYTVAEAIWMNQSGMAAKEELLRKLKELYSMAVKKTEDNNSQLDNKAEQFIINMNGQTDKKAMNTDEVQQAKDAYIKSNTMSVVCGFDIKNEINKLEAEIASFKAEVDAALSVSNATTMIEVSY